MPAHPLALLVVALAVILIGAKLGRDLSLRLGQPAVLGELLVGIVLGNLGLVGVHEIESFKTDALIDLFARLGVIVLLFEVGLESTVGQMMKVGLSALLVAILGVVAPFALGWGVARLMLPDHSVYVHVFLGATLTATSVGITARVLKDLGRSKTPEARIVLGAAVIDDVLGLVVLAVVGGIIAAADHGTRVSSGAIAWIIVKAAGFLVGSLAIGVLFSKRLLTLASRLRARGVLLAIGLAFCFVLAYLADRIGLAAIVGAFAAGLILEGDHSDQLQAQIQPISSFLAPIFFVVMGMRCDLATFASTHVLALAALLTVAAILGKQACALGVIGKGLDRLTVGLGMIPRGEVGLVFAGQGLTLMVAGERVVGRSEYAAVVLMVLLTTLVTPPALRYRLTTTARRSG